MSGHKLLPCPFCGGRAILRGEDGDMQPSVTCADCEADGTWCHEVPDAIAAWNRRTAAASDQAPGAAWAAKLAAIWAAVAAEREATARYYGAYRFGDRAPARAEQLRARIALDALLAGAGEVGDE